MPAFRDITGHRFGRLTVIEISRSDNGTIRWLCRCDCGKTLAVFRGNLKNGNTRSCGCLAHDVWIKARTKHGHAVYKNHTRTYRSWTAMLARCRNENRDNYQYYGERGIQVCERWLSSFANFLADMGERPPGLSLDRKDNDGDYEPDNCHWATRSQQMKNRRSFQKRLTP